MTATTIVDPRSHSEIVFRYVLERRAKDHPQRLFAAFMATGESWTWGDLQVRTNQMANALAAVGVSRGEAVALMGTNSPPFLQSFFGATKLGAIITPINTAYRGKMLRHVLLLSDAKVLVCEAYLLDRFEDLADELSLRHVVVIGEHDANRYPPPFREGAVSVVRQFRKRWIRQFAT